MVHNIVNYFNAFSSNLIHIMKSSRISSVLLFILGSSVYTSQPDQCLNNSWTGNCAWMNSEHITWHLTCKCRESSPTHLQHVYSVSTNASHGDLLSIKTLET